MTTLHNYYRVHLLDTQDSASYFISITRIEFRSTAGVSDVPSGGSVISRDRTGGTYGDAFKAFAYPSAFGSEAFDPDNGAFDGTGPMSTAQITGVGNESWIGYQFASAKDVRALNMMAHIENQGPYKFDVDYSDDGSSWTTAATYIYARWAFNVAHEFAVPSSGSHVYWRIRMREMQRHNTVLNVREIQFRQTAGVTEYNTGQTYFGLPGGGTWNTNMSIAFDGDASSGSTVNAVAVGPTNAFVDEVYAGVIFGTAREILEMAFTIDASTFNLAGPSALAIEVSNDGLTWVESDRYTSVGSWSANETKTFAVTPVDIVTPPPGGATKRPVLIICT